MKFIVDIENPQQQYVQITAHLQSEGDKTTVFLPAWRPGRYELGDFAKNINYFQVKSPQGEKLDFKKETKNSWVVNTKGVDEFVITYSYYANELNAGSTFLDETQLYVNPVNCFLFTEKEYNAEISVQLNVPKEWDIAHTFEERNGLYYTQGFDELADNPFICSSQLQHKTYEAGGVKFYVWFNGVVKPDWDRLIADFKAFSIDQIKRFVNLPTKEYHFLIHVLPYQAYHGVEHSKSTVITLGPSYAVFDELYKELLGVSSHELYHTWNVKNIRPTDWQPYDFKQENYSELGYIAEGVTTYMGDLLLYKSGVFNLQQYFLEMNTQIQRHLDNFGRFNYSVAQSSYDTWLDGYVPGAPHRKVSIYTEGCLLAFVADVFILKSTNNTKKLDDVMRVLYHEYGQNNIGVSKEDYQKELEKVAGVSMQWYFDDYLYGTTDYLPLLTESFNYLGLAIKSRPTSSEIATKWGAKVMDNKVAAVYPDSPYDKAGGMLGDEILSINGMKVNNDGDRWAVFFKEDRKEVLVNRNNQVVRLSIETSEEDYYKVYYLEELAYKTEEQEKAFEAWGE